jgi:hypothetical protein
MLLKDEKFVARSGIGTIETEPTEPAEKLAPLTGRLPRHARPDLASG